MIVHEQGQIIIKRKSNIPLVSMAIAARGGANQEARTQAGLTALMARTSIKGTRTRTAAQIAEAAENMGGSIAPLAGFDTLHWQITVPAKHFEVAWKLLVDVATNATFPEAESEVERKLALADLERLRDDMYRYPLRLCLQLAFADHAYGRTLADVASTLTATTSEDARAWHKEVTDDLWAFVVGDVDPDAVGHLVSTDSRTRTRARTRTETAGWRGGVSDVETRDKAQTAIALAFPGPDRNDPDMHSLQVLSNAVGGLGGRFFEELRSKRSLAYTVSWSPVARARGGAFVAYIATSPAREAEAIQALFEQFVRLVNEPLSSDDVARAQRYTIGTWQIRSQTNGAQLGDLLQAYLLGPGITEITDFENQIMAVTPDTILAAARRYFDPALAVTGIVRGKES
jgi:zinc protease